MWLPHNIVHQNTPKKHFKLLLCQNNYSNTGQVWYSNGRLCPVVKWSGFWMGVWKPDWKSLFMVQSVWYWNGPPIHMTSTFWIPDTHTARYLDESERYSDVYCISASKIFCSLILQTLKLHLRGSRSTSGCCKKRVKCEALIVLPTVF